MNFNKLLFLLVFFPFAVNAQLSGQVTYVIDGDTFHMVTESGEQFKIRVADIDCPERDQAYGSEARAFVANAIDGKLVTLKIKGTDRYGRKIAFVKYGKNDLSEELLKAGLAWHYRKYSDKDDFTLLEFQAKQDELGLWKDDEAIAPWVFRRKNK